MKSKNESAFSLLEVMVAISILGLALTVILSAQGGLSASNLSAKNMGTASTMARCKMTELEEKLLKYGYPEIDQTDTDVACCDDDKDPVFTCDIKTERILLPGFAQDGGSLEGGLGSSLVLGEGGIEDKSTAPTSSTGFALPGATDPAAAASGLMQGFSSFDLDAGVAGMGSQLTGQLSSMGGTEGLLTTVMGFVYPSLKVMMESAIRKLSVTVHWKEGGTARTFDLTQYVANPANGGFNGDAGTYDAGTAPSLIPTSLTGGLGGATKGI